MTKWRITTCASSELEEQMLVARRLARRDLADWQLIEKSYGCLPLGYRLPLCFSDGEGDDEPFHMHSPTWLPCVSSNV